MRIDYLDMIDEYKLISGDDIEINNHIKLKHPTIKEILIQGEEKYYNDISLFIATPYNYIIELWDMGIYYNELTNWDLFIKLFNGEMRSNSNKYKNIIGDYDFVLRKNLDTNELVFYCESHDFIIDELIYTKISMYLKHINNIPLENEINVSKDKSFSKPLIEGIIKNEKEKRENRAKKQKQKNKNFLLSYVNKLVWGTNRSYDEILNLTLYRFKMGIKTLDIIKNYEEIKLGYYTGTFDTKKIKIQHNDWLHSNM